MSRIAPPLLLPLPPLPPPRHWFGPLCLMLSLALALAAALPAPGAPAQPGSPPVPKPHPEVQALLDQGRAARAASGTEEALRLYQEALEKSRLLNDRAGEGRALLDIGNVYNATGQPQKALEFHQQALLLYLQAGDKAGEANALGNIGTDYILTGQPQKALESLQQSLALLRQLGNKASEAVVLGNLGRFHQNNGQPQKALEFYQQALALYRQSGNKRSEALVLNNLGIACTDLRQPQKALEFHQQSLALCRQIGDKDAEADALGNIGTVYKVTGQPQKGLEFQLQSLALCRQLGNKRKEADVLGNVGGAYADLGQPQKALEFFQQSLPLERQVGNKRGEANALSNIGNVYRLSGQPQKGLEWFQQSLALFRQAGDRAGEALALNNLGVIYRETGQPQKALEFFQQALALYRQVGNKTGEATALWSLAVVQDKRGSVVEAERSLRDAVALLESVRGELGGLSEAKVSFLTSKLGTYHRYIQLLLKRNKPAEAFAVAQKTKARALLDLMASGRVDIGQQMSAAERAEEQELRGRADRLNVRMVREGVENEAGAGKRFAALKDELARAESDLQKSNDRLYARHPDLARKRAARTATPADVAGFLPADTALLEYVLLIVGDGKEAEYRSLLFVVTRKAGRAAGAAGVEVRAYSLPLGGEVLAKKARALRAACAHPGEAYAAQSREMHRLLLPPAAARQLAGKRRLVVCPDGPLWDVPFAALRDGRGRFLLERFEVAYAYSATGAQAALLAGAQKQKQQRRGPSSKSLGTLLALANPDFGGGERSSGGGGAAAPPPPVLVAASRGLLLPRGGRLASLPGTQREADMLQRRFPGASVFTGAEAQEARVKERAGRCRYLHLASHAFFNDAAPLLSSVALATPPAGDGQDDGFLTAREIFELDLSGTDLVVLSACNTARGEKRSGEGVVGLTWALFVAGAPTQVLSQWAVEDSSTATLMQRFYGGLPKGQAKGAALRAAALSLMKDGKHAHPFFWAPFVLMGDWRK